MYLWKYLGSDPSKLALQKDLQVGDLLEVKAIAQKFCSILCPRSVGSASLSCFEK